MAKAIAFNCPNCGANLNITAVGHTISVACHSCGSVIDTANENYQILSKVRSKQTCIPYIPIGSRGKLSGTKFEVIGFMQRCDYTETYFWREYCLYNPYKGFYWLFEFDGHWSFFKTIKNKPSQLSIDEIQYLGEKTYKLFNSDRCKVNYVEGEFYWRVKVGDQSEIQDYIHPPYQISKEKARGETIWTYGKYIEARHIEKIFAIDQEPPRSQGVAPNQPSTYNQSNAEVWKMAWIYLGLVFLVLFCSLFT